MDGGLPPEHWAQVRHNLWISGAGWCDFVSFDDRVAPTWQLFVVRVEAAELDLAGYERQAIAFLDDVATELSAIVRLLTPSGVRASC